MIDLVKQSADAPAAGAATVSVTGRLIEMLLADMPECAAQASRFSADEEAQRTLLRGLMNMRSAQLPLGEEFFKLQDELLAGELAARQLTGIDDLRPVTRHPCLRHWHGDITALRVDAIVNAASPDLLGCFIAGHACVDNCVHSAAGLQLRHTCRQLMKGTRLKPGEARLTPAFNLPCRYVLHTVPPQIGWQLSQEEDELLCSCYRSCLELARRQQVKSLAFCCLGTGQARFPHGRAATLAVQTVIDDLDAHSQDLTVVFVTYTEVDDEIYAHQLNPDPEQAKRDEHPFFNLSLI